MKRDTNYKYHQKEWDRNNENISPSARSIRRSKKLEFDRLRSLISDKIWYDSLTIDEKESVHSNWFFVYPSVSKSTWVSWSSEETFPIEGEKVEEYCKRMTPGCKNTQRDLKLSKLLSLK